MSTSKLHEHFSGQADDAERMLADTGAMFDLLHMIQHHDYSTPVPDCGALLRLARRKHWICDDPKNPHLVVLTAIGRAWMLEQRVW